MYNAFIDYVFPLYYWIRGWELWCCLMLLINRMICLCLYSACSSLTPMHCSLITPEGLWSSLWTFVINRGITNEMLFIILNDGVSAASALGFQARTFPPKTIISCSMNLWNGVFYSSEWEHFELSSTPNVPGVNTNDKPPPPRLEVSFHVWNEGVMKTHLRCQGVARTKNTRRRVDPHWMKKMKGQGVCCMPKRCSVASCQRPWKSPLEENQTQYDRTLNTAIGCSFCIYLHPQKTETPFLRITWLEYGAHRRGPFMVACVLEGQQALAEDQKQVYVKAGKEGGREK